MMMGTNTLVSNVLIMTSSLHMISGKYPDIQDSQDITNVCSGFVAS
jgi:hypothetical protein